MKNALLPSATLGVVGGGQLGLMFVHAAQRLGYKTTVLELDESAPAAGVSHHHVRSQYDNPTGLEPFCRQVDAVTIEFENVPANTLDYLAQYRPTRPAAAAVAVCQDRVREKQFFIDQGVTCVPYTVLQSLSDEVHATDLDALAADVDTALFPAILKTTQMGYDGKGQVTVASQDALAAAWASLAHTTCILEKRVDLLLEVSVIVARGENGDMVHLPVAQNHHVGGILVSTQVPAPDLSPEQSLAAVQATKQLAAALSYVGVLCVEFFVTKDGQLLANEMAPRPHNSGHASMDCMSLSQFDLQVRTLAGLPLVQPEQMQSAVMLNLMGDLWFVGEGKSTPQSPDWESVLAVQGAHLHLYGKTVPKKARKMGHLTLTAGNAQQAKARALQCAAILGIENTGLNAMLNGEHTAVPDLSQVAHDIPHFLEKNN